MKRSRPVQAELSDESETAESLVLWSALEVSNSSRKLILSSLTFGMMNSETMEVEVKDCLASSSLDTWNEPNFLNVSRPLM